MSNNIKSVITGDIIDSSSIHLKYRDILLESIYKIADDLSIIEPLKIEIFRGDSFQMLVDKPENSMKIAILFRAGLKCCTPVECNKLWDARLSIGVGGISYRANSILQSDGEAFQYSGRELDAMGKCRLVVKTNCDDLNEELKVSTSFADDIISSWTKSQSQAIYQSLLYNIPQKVIAQKLQKSAQNISKLLSAAKIELIRKYLNRFSQLISNKIS